MTPLIFREYLRFRYPNRFRNQILAELPQKRLDIGDQPHRLESSTIAQLGHDGGVNIHTDRFDRRRQKVAGRDGVQRRGHHQGEAHTARFLAHQILGLQSIGDHIRQRPIIADGPREHKIHPFLDAAIKYPVLNQPLFYRRSDSAGFSDRVDRPKMMLVTFASANLPVYVDTQ